MGFFDGKRGVILGVANDRSIAWAIASEIMRQGGECGFTHLPDKPEDDKQKNRRRVQKCIDEMPERCKFLVPLNVQDDANIEAVMEKAKSEFGTIDFLLHSVAFAKLEDLDGETINTSRDGFHLAMDISAYSLIACCRAARSILKPAVVKENSSGRMELVEPGASVLTMTYFGGEKAVPGYNVMGICKAALDSCMKYLAFDLGAQGVRVNALSAGPLVTLAGVGAGVKEMLELYENMAPLGRNITQDQVGRVGAFLLSTQSEGITGEIMHVDAGYNMMGSPGRLLDKLKPAS